MSISVSTPSRIQLAPTSKSAIRVMICDDSAVIRSILCRVLVDADGIDIVRQTANGIEAIDYLRLNPGHVDVLILDIEMPKMDGLTALPLLVAIAPKMRIVIASTLTKRGAATTLEAMRLGAHDYLAKPSATALSDDQTFQRELIDKIRALGSRASQAASIYKVRPTRGLRKVELVAIGSSTGGPQALSGLLGHLKSALGSRGLQVPVVLTQHMPSSFTPLLADQLTRSTGLPCVEVRDGDLLTPGRIHIAPGGRHLLVARSREGNLIGQLDDSAPENFCRPSVEPMLRSATSVCNGRVLMLMLTGMGQDGLQAAQTLVAAGGTVLAQDEASSVVWGMPGAVARAALCEAILPVQAMADLTARILQGLA